MLQPDGVTQRPYQELLARLRDTFPAPVSDRKHDAYFVFSILRALDQVDDLKSEVPLLGRPRTLDYAAAERAELSEEGRSVEEVTRQLVGQLEGMPIWGHPRTQINVVPPPSIPSVIGSLLPAIYNPNLVSDDTSYGLMLTEAAVVAMVSRLVGYDPARAAGVFTFGGTGTVLYGAKLGIEKAFPDAMDNGVPGGGMILASAQSHYCRLNVAGWLGLGEKSVVAVPTHLENDIRVDRLEAVAREALDQGRRIVALVATMGTTDAFGVDDLDAIADLRDRLVKEYDLDYRPHIHADAVIGWAWSVFNDYDFEANPLGFRPRTVRALAAARRRISKLHRADSVGIDFHKTGFTPYISSLFLARDRADMQLLVRGREQMPYLFQSGERHPGVFTPETSRGGSGVLAAYANLQLFGQVGLRVLLGHLVEMAETLREHLKRFSDSPCTAWARRGTSACTNAGGPMQAYSMDLRERALLDSDAGMKAADVAVKYRVSGSWVRLLKQRRRETGEVAPRVQRHGRRRMLEPHLHTLAALIAEQPDRTLAELKDALGTPASLATIWRAVAALDVTVKKNGPAVRTRST